MPLIVRTQPHSTPALFGLDFSSCCCLLNIVPTLFLVNVQLRKHNKRFSVLFFLLLCFRYLSWLGWCCCRHNRLSLRARLVSLCDRQGDRLAIYRAAAADAGTTQVYRHDNITTTAGLWTFSFRLHCGRFGRVEARTMAQHVVARYYDESGGGEKK